MSKFNQKFFLSCSCVLIILVSACIQNEPQSKKPAPKSNASKTQVLESSYRAVNSWPDDLENFRKAISINDVDKLKTYFSFPVDADTTEVWFAIYDNVEESKRPKVYSNTFTEADFEKHNKSLFNNAFTKTLNKLNGDELYKKGEYTTSKLKENSQNFYMVANYDKATAMLQLSVIFSGELDENGEELSETEHATIYFFKVDANKHLKFDKILFAG